MLCSRWHSTRKKNMNHTEFCKIEFPSAFWVSLYSPKSLKTPSKKLLPSVGSLRSGSRLAGCLLSPQDRWVKIFMAGKSSVLIHGHCRLNQLKIISRLICHKGLGLGLHLRYSHNSFQCRFRFSIPVIQHRVIGPSWDGVIILP